MGEGGKYKIILQEKSVGRTLPHIPPFQTLDNSSHINIVHFYTTHVLI